MNAATHSHQSRNYLEFHGRKIPCVNDIRLKTTQDLKEALVDTDTLPRLLMQLDNRHIVSLKPS